MRKDVWPRRCPSCGGSPLIHIVQSWVLLTELPSDVDNEPVWEAWIECSSCEFSGGRVRCGERVQSYFDAVWLWNLAWCEWRGQ